MYDQNKVILGLVIFIGLMAFPILYNAGDAGALPKPVKPEKYKECVKPVQYMRTTHMQLIDEWRDEVLREGKREPIEIRGEKFEKSLMNGCLHCHDDKKKFCDECHTYASVKPYCWDCHYTPKETL